MLHQTILPQQKDYGKLWKIQVWHLFSVGDYSKLLQYYCCIYYNIIYWTVCFKKSRRNITIIRYSLLAKHWCDILSAGCQMYAVIGPVCYENLTLHTSILHFFFQILHLGDVLLFRLKGILKTSIICANSRSCGSYSKNNSKHSNGYENHKK